MYKRTPILAEETLKARKIGKVKKKKKKKLSTKNTLQGKAIIQN